MSQAIYKYTMSDVGTSEVRLPAGAKVLDFQYQRGGFSQQLVLWAIVDTEPKEHVTRKFRVIATGQVYDFHNRKYRKTIQDGEGCVWHIFEIIG